jgi:hypothetical protein
VQILPLVPGLCANRATTVFTQRRIRAVFAAIAARASRLRILVVRQSLPSKSNRAGRTRRTMRETGKMGGSCTERQCELMQTRDVAAARSNQAQSRVVQGHRHYGLNLQHCGSLFHHHALRLQARSPSACPQFERTQANNRPGVETEPRQFQSRPQRLPLTNQKQIPCTRRPRAITLLA